MHLVVRPRLSVQPVTKDAWNTINLLASQGGWDQEGPVPGPSTNKRKAEGSGKKGGRRTSKRKKHDTDEEGAAGDGKSKKSPAKPRRGKPRRAKQSETGDEQEQGGSDIEEEGHAEKPDHGILKNADEGGGNVNGVVVYGATDEDPEEVEKRNEKVDVQEDVKVIEPQMKRAVR